jgi:hypothetical protein
MTQRVWPEGPPERLLLPCAGCGKEVATYWVPGPGGMLSSPDHFLVANWVYHNECWNRVEAEGIAAGLI